MAYKYFMNNPCGARVGDCAVRAISQIQCTETSASANKC